MSVITLEGVVDNGQIKLKGNVRLPENAKVFVVVPDVQVEQLAHTYTPRLVHREDAADFKMEVIGEFSDTGL